MNNYNEYEVVAAATYLLLKLKFKKRSRRSRSVWVKRWIQEGRRNHSITGLLPTLSREDPNSYFNFLRMTQTDFDYLLGVVQSRIQKKDTLMRDAIPAATRLALTLRYLATGDSYHSLQYLFYLPVCTISTIIPEVAQAIYECLKDEFLKMPDSTEEWEELAKNFEEKWNFPNCVAAVDGKHIDIKAPKNAGSEYYNYKNRHSIVLMAAADADYKIIYFHIGAKGRNADGGVFTDSGFGQALRGERLNLPEPKPLPGRAKRIPYCIVADDAFPLEKNIMKPYSHNKLSGPERVFNYRLSRARRIIENVFGILSAKFRILRRSIELPPEKVQLLVAAACVLHNFLITRSGKTYAPRGTFDYEDIEEGRIVNGTWRVDEIDLVCLRRIPRRLDSEAKRIQYEFQEYFFNEGEIPWQYKFI